VELHHRLAKADDDTLAEIRRQAELQLSAQLTSALAANQRAMSFTALLTPVTVVLAGASGTLLLGTPPRLWLGWILFAMALGFLTALAFAMSAVVPTQFYFVGTQPENWASDADESRPAKQTLPTLLQHYSEMIADNASCMERSDGRLLWAMRITWLTLAGGVCFGVPILAFGR
jgi:hypothetical protein